MSEHSLPKTVDPLKYADQNKVLKGALAVKCMPRLLDMLADDSGEVKVELEFDRDEQNLRVVTGRLEAELWLECQRCLSPVQKTLVSEFALGIVLSDEQAKNLPKHYEPLLVEPEELILRDMVEEELILSLPMFAYHEHCGSGETESVSEKKDADEAPPAEKENPFSVLSELKVKK